MDAQMTLIAAQYFRAKFGPIDVTDCTFAMVIESIGSHERVSSEEAAFRVGLCAAADELLSVDVQSNEARMARGNSAEHILRSVGISIDDWTAHTGAFFGVPAKEGT